MCCLPYPSVICLIGFKGIFREVIQFMNHRWKVSIYTNFCKDKFQTTAKTYFQNGGHGRELLWPGSLSNSDHSWWVWDHFKTLNNSVYHKVETFFFLASSAQERIYSNLFKLRHRICNQQVYMSHSQMFQKVESGWGPIIKVVLEC